MKRALAILAGVVMVSVIAYLSWMNPTPVEFRWSSTQTISGNLGVFMVFAFLAGAVLVLTAGMIQASRRAFAAWRVGRRQRRDDRIDAWEERGDEFVWKGDVQQGRAMLQKAWHRRPESAHAVLALAASYRDTGELHRSRGLLFDAANQHHTNPAVLLALADVHHAAGERAPRIEVLERLRALHPHSPRALRALRDAYVEAERWQEASALQETLLGELRDAAEATREREFLTVLRYQAAMATPDIPARIRALESLADSRAGSIPIFVSLGDALHAAGRADEASVLWERALRSTPRTVLADRLAAIASQPRHYDRLRTVLRKLRAAQVDEPNVHVLTAQLYLADGHVDEAARELEAIKSDGDGGALYHRLWGEVRQRRGQLADAVSAYARAAGTGTSYRCRACQRATDQWVGYCSGCGQWDSYRSAVEIGNQ